MHVKRKEIYRAAMKAEYLPFYLEGRDAKLVKNDIDEDDLAQQIVDTGKTPYDVLHAAAEAAVKVIAVDQRKKKLWLNEHEDDVKEAGGSADDAWNAFIAGRTDELCSALETPVLEALEEIVFEGDEDESAEDDDEEDEDESEDEPEK